MQKTPWLIIVFILVVSLFTTQAYALIVRCTEYPLGTADSVYANKISVVHPSATGVYSAVFQTFKTDFNDTLLTDIQFACSKLGAPNAFFGAALFLTEGTYGSTSKPTGNAVATATPRQISGLDASVVMVNWDFDGTYTLIADVVYAAVMYEINETTCDTSNTLQLQYDIAGSYAGNMGYYANSGWSTAVAGYDAGFAVYGDGGDIVTYVGGNTYFDTESTVYNVTASATEVALTSATQTADLMFYTLLILTFGCLLLMLRSGVPIINFVFGVMTLGIAAYSLQTSTIVFFGYIQMFAILMASLCMLSGYRSYRNE